MRRGLGRERGEERRVLRLGAGGENKAMEMDILGGAALLLVALLLSLQSQEQGERQRRRRRRRRGKGRARGHGMENCDEF